MNKFPCLSELSIPAPIAKVKKYKAEHHNDLLEDDYFWLKDESYPEVKNEEILSYLNAENAYYESFLKPHTSLIDTVFNEMKGRTDEYETSVPYQYNGYEYRWYFKEGQEYRTRVRKDLVSGDENIFIDENELAKDHEYFVLGCLLYTSPSPRDLSTSRMPSSA